MLKQKAAAECDRDMRFSACGGNERLLANVLERPASFSAFNPSLELHSSGSWNSSLDPGEQFQQGIKASAPCCVVGTQNSQRNKRAPFPERFSHHGLNFERHARCWRDRSVDKDSREWAKDMRAQKKQTRQTHKLPLINRHEEIR